MTRSATPTNHEQLVDSIIDVATNTVGTRTVALTPVSGMLIPDLSRNVGPLWQAALMASANGGIGNLTAPGESRGTTPRQTDYYYRYLCDRSQSGFLADIVYRAANTRTR